MFVKTLVLGATGSGKSSSICQIPEYEIQGLNPAETFIVACKRKELPIRGWMNLYTQVPEGQPPDSGHYRYTNRAQAIANTLTHISGSRPDIKNVVLDDLNYVMQDRYMNNTSTGYKIFTDIGNDMAIILRAVEDCNKNVVVFMHYEAVDETYGVTYKAKTVGKMVDNYLTIEGMFSNVLFCKQIVEQGTQNIHKVFVTNYDGQFSAKTPVGAFTETYIKNDMGYVLNTLSEYYGMSPVATTPSTPEVQTNLFNQANPTQ